MDVEVNEAQDDPNKKSDNNQTTQASKTIVETFCDKPARETIKENALKNAETPNISLSFHPLFASTPFTKRAQLVEINPNQEAPYSKQLDQCDAKSGNAVKQPQFKFPMRAMAGTKTAKVPHISTPDVGLKKFRFKRQTPAPLEIIASDDEPSIEEIITPRLDMSKESNVVLTPAEEIQNVNFLQTPVNRIVPEPKTLNSLLELGQIPGDLKVPSRKQALLDRGVVRIGKEASQPAKIKRSKRKFDEPDDEAEGVDVGVEAALGSPGNSHHGSSNNEVPSSAEITKKKRSKRIFVEAEVENQVAIADVELSNANLDHVPTSAGNITKKKRTTHKLVPDDETVVKNQDTDGKVAVASGNNTNKKRTKRNLVPDGEAEDENQGMDGDVEVSAGNITKKKRTKRNPVVLDDEVEDENQETDGDVAMASGSQGNSRRGSVSNGDFIKYDPKDRGCLRDGLRVRRYMRPWWIHDGSADSIGIEFGTFSYKTAQSQLQYEKLKKKSTLTKHELRILDDPGIIQVHPDVKIKTLKRLQTLKRKSKPLPRNTAIWNNSFQSEVSKAPKKA